MIRLIVVEDEPLMQEFIINCIDWEKLKVKVVGTFYDGMDALNFICKNQVDIVITDINMPGMDGLSLIEHALDHDQNIKVIVLSSYNDFHMVKSAFKYGVDDYILKNEFEPENFETLLRDIVAKIVQRDRNQSGEYIIKEHKLKQFFWGSGNVTFNSKLRIDTNGSLCTVVIKLLNYRSVLEPLWENDRILFNYGMSNCIEEVLDDFKQGEFFLNSCDEIIILFNTDSNINSKTEEVLERLLDVLVSTFSLVINAGIYDDTSDCSLKKQYQCACMALEFGFILGRNKLISYKNTHNFSGEFNYKEANDDFEHAYETQNFDLILSRLTELGNTYPAYECLPLIRTFCQRVINEIYEFALSNGVDSYELKSVTMDTETIMSLVQKLSCVVERVSNSVYSHDTTMEVIKNYIKKNYFKHISLRDIAKEFKVDYTNLSKRFYKTQGITYSKFLTDIRLKEAIELIKTTDYKMVEISEMVGYNNYATFSRAFRDKYGKWPNQIIRGNVQ